MTIRHNSTELNLDYFSLIEDSFYLNINTPTVYDLDMFEENEPKNDEAITYNNNKT